MRSPFLYGFTKRRALSLSIMAKYRKCVEMILTKVYLKNKINT